MSITNVGETLSNIHGNIIKVFEDGARIATGSDYNQADVDKHWQDIDNVGKVSSRDSLNEAYAQVKEAATKHLMDRGWSKAGVDGWFNPRWAKILNAAEKARGSMPEVEKAAHSVWRQLVGFVGAIAALAAGTAIIATVNSGPTPEKQSILDFLHRDQVLQQQIQRWSDIMIREEEFRRMVNVFDIPNLPPAIVLQETPVAVPVAMPASIKAVAALPLLVEVSHGPSAYIGRTTVGEVYQNVPQARQQIDTHADLLERLTHESNERIERAFAEYTGRSRDDDQQQYRVNIDVDAGFARARFYRP